MPYFNPHTDRPLINAQHPVADSVGGKGGCETNASARSWLGSGYLQKNPSNSFCPARRDQHDATRLQPECKKIYTLKLKKEENSVHFI